MHIKSYSGIELSFFPSDHAVWCDTQFDPYCINDDLAKQSLLCWTEAAMSNFVQFWRITPAGLGMFFDIHSGQQIVIVAMQDITNEDNNLLDFDRLNPTFDIKTGLEAIPLQPENCLHVYIHFYFANDIKLCFV